MKDHSGDLSASIDAYIDALERYCRSMHKTSNIVDELVKVLEEKHYICSHIGNTDFGFKENMF